MIRFKIKPHLVLWSALALTLGLCAALALLRAPHLAGPFIASAVFALKLAVAGAIVLLLLAKTDKWLPGIRIPASGFAGTVACLAVAFGCMGVVGSIMAGGVAALVG